MQFTQTGKLGVLAMFERLLIENRLQYTQRDDPDNPVVVGCNTIITAPKDTGWSVAGPNLRMNGTGTKAIYLPPGHYEITLDT